MKRVSPRHYLGAGVSILGLMIFSFGSTGCEIPAALDRRPEGEKLWAKRCGRCHGVDARGNTPKYMGNPAVDLTDDRWRHGGPDDYSLELIIREGIFGSMPRNEDLTREQMRALIQHLRRLRAEG